MDTLTFNSPLLLRHLTFSEAKKAPISEINLKVVLEELDMTMERVSLSGFFISIEAKLSADREHAPRPLLVLQFIELCILLGCDYLEPAKGIGPKTALKLMREHGSLEAIESFVRGKMAEKVADAQAEAGIEPEEIESDEEDKAPPSPDVDMDLESEDGYEKRVAADMSGDEEEMDEAGTSSKASKKKKIVVDSDEEDEPVTEKKKAEKKKPDEDDEEEPVWEASPEPESRSQKSKSPEKKPMTDSKKKPTKKAVKAETASSSAGAASGSKPKRKVGIKGGMQLPEYWPWREAKEVFMKPDVTPGDDLEVSWA